MIEEDEVVKKNKRRNKMLLPTRIFEVVLLCSALLVSCQKENISSNRLVIAAEGIGSGQSKMYVDDKVSYWEDGDELLINGARVAIHMDGSGDTYAELDSYNPNNNYWGGTTDYFLYNVGSNLTYNLPHLYQYRVVTVNANTYQKLEAPMVGYKTPADEKLVLKHLTGVLMVNVHNHANGSSPIVIDRITVSNDQGYKLCGSLTVNYTTANGDGFSVSPQTGASGEESSVIMDFGNGLSIDYDDSKTVQIPIRVAGTNGVPVKYNVKVEGHINSTRYTFEQEQTTGGVLGRAVAGYANVDVNPAGGHTSTGPLFSSIVGGDSRTYYQLYTPSDWRLMTECGSRNVNYILMDDLDMTNVITNTIPNYSGIIAGNFHTISNLIVISSTGGEPSYLNCGIIEYASNITISNLTINGITLKRRSGTVATIPFGGAIAAFNSGTINIDGVTIDNFHFDFGDVTSSSLILGGFIGDIQSNNVSIENSSLSFAPGEVLNCSGMAQIGGVASGRYSYSSGMHCTPTLNNVSINFNNLTINQASSANTYFGGLLGKKNYASVTPTNSNVYGTIQINSNGTIYKGKVYGDSSEIPDGITVSGLIWN